MVDKTAKNWDKNLESFFEEDIDGVLFLEDYLERIFQHRVWNDTFTRWEEDNCISEEERDDAFEAGVEEGISQGYDMGVESGFEDGCEEGRSRQLEECEVEHV
jgi:flagellar biosynthesis/type III secretory pathway protein FliH